MSSSKAFVHELHSLRVVDKLAFRPSTQERGLNLTYEVRDGIISHCGERTEQRLAPRTRMGPWLELLRERGQAPFTMEGCVVRLADRIAYIGRDYEDAVSVMGPLAPLPAIVTRVLGRDNRTIINTLVTDVIQTNLRSPGELGFSDGVFEALSAMYRYNLTEIYQHPRLEEYAERTENMLRTIFDFEQRELAARKQSQWGQVQSRDPAPMQELHRFIRKMYPRDDQPDLTQIVIDHISLMTDRFARNLFEDIFLPKPVG
jgi:dGTPase